MNRRPAIVRSALADQVYETLRDRILDLAVGPGKRLVIDQLARELGVSQTPVRDALSRLAGEGFIESAPFRGFTVLPVPSFREIEESFEARSIVEVAAVEFACLRRSEADMAALRAVQHRIVEQHTGPRARSYAPFGRLNQEFHRVLVEASGNRYLADALRAIDHDARMARTMHGRGVPDLSNIVEEHQQIVEAVEARTIELARCAVARHIEDGLRRVLAVRRERDEES